jgi:hypothetical protein
MLKMFHNAIYDFYLNFNQSINQSIGLLLFHIHLRPYPFLLNNNCLPELLVWHHLIFHYAVKTLSISCNSGIILRLRWFIFMVVCHIQCKQSKKLDIEGDFQMHKWPYIWEENESRVVSHTLKWYIKLCMLMKLSPGNLTTRRKPPTCRKSLTNKLMYYTMDFSFANKKKNCEY